jgi:hypothetical protein
MILNIIISTNKEKNCFAKKKPKKSPEPESNQRQFDIIGYGYPLQSNALPTELSRDGYCND